MYRDIIVIRGGGDIASGTIHKLYRSGFKILVLDIEKPSAIRRAVSFCEAIYDGESVVEGVKAVKVRTFNEIKEAWQNGFIPIAIDEKGSLIEELKPKVVVDAILAKRNMGTNKSMAPITIGLGPGFEAGKDVDAVIETMRGHDLGRIILEGKPMENTGMPGEIKGYSKERVIYSGKTGIINTLSKIGDKVEKGQVIATIGDHKVLSSIDGILRGIIKDQYKVTEKFKIADVDPRYSELKNCFTISDKARCIAGSVLEAILMLERQKV
ncbi:selenium-dependent molybdenum cofactor biosynthesis protein YqeB [Clostridium hydrogeniformans]|uniref:selenium-dependent molybdenum cofactor biosynthesis protein YqeB n=1 Tax=Clostridium hydrogeniformans TaxID=349933 RepID=UPI0004801217|nr:selenium-dependent molybdenum cofactor biosynthesis protein YqeB [Clostridium hydrogeniformans]